MRKVALILFFIFSFSNIGKVYSRNLQIDTCLVGTWSGSEKDEQVKGVQVNWIQYRYPNGKLLTRFTTTYLGEQSVSTETGKWWVENGKFYEKSDESKKPDIYSYEVVDKNHIIFRAIKLGTDFENKNYQFVDAVGARWRGSVTRANME